MKIATLGLVTQGDDLLLGRKKKGKFGVGKLCGPGGERKSGETFEECLLRETREEFEIELNPTSLELGALIDFYADGKPDCFVYVYHARILSGEIHETAEMIPARYPINDLPFKQMFEADEHWVPKFLRGEKFRANVYYRERGLGLIRIDPLPWAYD